MRGYEYKVISMNPISAYPGQETSHMETTLNLLGKEGWQLVSCSTTTAGFLAGGRIIATAVLLREIGDVSKKGDVA